MDALSNVKSNLLPKAAAASISEYDVISSTVLMHCALEIMIFEE